MKKYAPDRPHFQEGKCAGECCRMIMLSVSPERIAALAAESRLPSSDFRHYDAEFVVQHFIPVKLSWYDPINGGRWPDKGKPRMVYRCAVWDGATKRCTDYERRPWLCRDFGKPPNPCRVKGCTLHYTPIWRQMDAWEDDGGPARTPRGNHDA